jgi:hypothetical protein
MELPLTLSMFIANLHLQLTSYDLSKTQLNVPYNQHEYCHVFMSVTNINGRSDVMIEFIRLLVKWLVITVNCSNS